MSSRYSLQHKSTLTLRVVLFTHSPYT